MIEVYYAPPSLYGRKVLAVLMEKNLDYTIKAMSFMAGDHKKPEYLKINPNGQIPTLVDEGVVIYESTAIAEYLDEEYPFPALMPQSSQDRAKVRMIEDYCDLYVYPALVNCLIKKVIHKQELLAADKDAVAKTIKRIEHYLGKKDFLAGDFSLADCAFMPAITTLPLFEYGDLIESSTELKTYAARLSSRPSFQAALMLE